MFCKFQWLATLLVLTSKGPKPHMHGIYNHPFDLYTTLHSICDTKTQRVKTDQLLHKKNAAGLNVDGVSTHASTISEGSCVTESRHQIVSPEYSNGGAHRHSGQW